MSCLSVHSLGVNPIPTHCWNRDGSLLALADNSSSITIYAYEKGAKEAAGALRPLTTLMEHDQYVSCLDWAPKRDLLLSCSHDRNAYVWSREGGDWVPSLVILRLTRAATCGRWSPNEKKFAVGSGAKSVCVCYYESENNWWVSKVIKKKHKSTVLAVAWHPSSMLLATASTDNVCRVFTAYVAGVDAKEEMVPALGKEKKGVFGEALIEVEMGCGWVHSVAWSPSGGQLAFAAHNAAIYILRGLDAGRDWAEAAPPTAQTVMLRGLPARDLLFLDEGTMVGAGFDCSPVIYKADASGHWKEERVLKGEKKAKVSGAKFGAALAMFKSQDERGEAGAGKEEGPVGPHTNAIVCLQAVTRQQDGKTTLFSSSGIDGRLVLWSTSPDALKMSGLSIAQ